MKLFPSFAIRFGLLTAIATAFAAGTALRAADEPADNLATADNGAYIIFSTPLKGGASANFLTQDGGRQLYFSNQPGSKLIVLDLGKTYALGSVRLKFKNAVKFEVYVRGSKPDGGDWTSVLGGKPDFISDSAGLQQLLKGEQGRFIIFVTQGDPGPFYGLYVTGIFVPYPNGGGALLVIDHHHDLFDSGNGGGLPECPFPYQDYFPPVFPPSP
jgi:hypothetical protein